MIAVFFGLYWNGLQSYMVFIVIIIAVIFGPALYSTHKFDLNIPDPINKAQKGSRGLSMFYLELRDKNGELNNIQVHKLKNKLGTRQLPTAELNLNGTVAQRIGAPGQGIKIISGFHEFLTSV